MEMETQLAVTSVCILERVGWRVDQLITAQLLCVDVGCRIIIRSPLIGYDDLVTATVRSA